MWTLIVISFVLNASSAAAASTVVPGFETLEACEAAAAEIKVPMWNGQGNGSTAFLNSITCAGSK